MPKIMEFFGYIIYFWSNEGKPLEPIHVHVAKRPSKNGTKIWILSDGTALIADNKGDIPPKDLKMLLESISTYHENIENAWKIHFGVSSITYYNRQISR